MSVSEQSDYWQKFQRRSTDIQIFRLRPQSNFWLWYFYSIANKISKTYSVRALTQILSYLWFLYKKNYIYTFNIVWFCCVDFTASSLTLLKKSDKIFDSDPNHWLRSPVSQVHSCPGTLSHIFALIVMLPLLQHVELYFKLFSWSVDLKYYWPFYTHPCA